MRPGQRLERLNTFQAYVGIGIVVDGGEIVVLLFLVAKLDDVTVEVELGRVALQNVPAIAGMLDSLEAAC